MTFNTANGQTLATHMAEFPFPGVEGSLYAFVLPNSPCLLSLRQLCLHEGFTYDYASAKRPLLIQPDGGVIEFFYQGRHSTGRFHHVAVQYEVW